MGNHGRTHLPFIARLIIPFIINTNVVKTICWVLECDTVQVFKPALTVSNWAPSLLVHPPHLARFISKPTTVTLAGHRPVTSLNRAKLNSTFSKLSNAKSSVVAR